MRCYFFIDTFWAGNSVTLMVWCVPSIHKNTPEHQGHLETFSLPVSRNGRSRTGNNISQHHLLRLLLMVDLNSLSFLYLETTTGNQRAKAVAGEKMVGPVSRLRGTVQVAFEIVLGFRMAVGRREKHA